MTSKLFNTISGLKNAKKCWDIGNKTAGYDWIYRKKESQEDLFFHK